MVVRGTIYDAVVVPIKDSLSVLIGYGIGFFITWLVRQSIAVPAKLATVTDRDFIYVYSIVNNGTRIIGEAVIRHAVHYHLGYSQLPDCGFISGFVVDIQRHTS